MDSVKYRENPTILQKAPNIYTHLAITYRPRGSWQCHEHEQGAARLLNRQQRAAGSGAAALCPCAPNCSCTFRLRLMGSEGTESQGLGTFHQSITKKVPIILRLAFVVQHWQLSVWIRHPAAAQCLGSNGLKVKQTQSRTYIPLASS